MKSYDELTVWKKSMALAVNIYRLIKLLPKEETYALSDQMRRAVVSIPSNIAEGQGRNSDKDFLKFLSISRGSCYELQTQIKLAEQIGYLPSAETKEVLLQCDEIAKMLNALMKRLSANR